MSSKSKVEYPRFDLRKYIAKYVNSSCVSKDVASNLADAKERLKDGKTEYYQYLYLYTSLKDILLENSYGVSDPLFEVGNNENIYEVIFQLLCTVAAKYCLDISSNPNSAPAEGNLFGFAFDDFDVKASTKTTMYQTIQQVLIPEVEKQMKSLILDIFRLLNPRNNDREGLALAKAIKMLHFISSEKEELMEAKLTIANEQIRSYNVYQEYIANVSATLYEIEDDYNYCNEMQLFETNKVNVDWLTATCDFSLTKIKVMNNCLFFDTYTKEKVECLKKIHLELSKQIKVTRKEIQKTKKSLEMYESIGDSFTNLLNEYTKLNIDIENKKWALAELKSSASL